MKNIFSILFTSVNIGEKWYEYHENPFTYSASVKILDVKEGWVKFMEEDTGSILTSSVLDFKTRYKKSN